MLNNCKIVKFSNHTDGRGDLIALEYPKDIDFPIKRIYYIYNVKEEVARGYHSHKELNQILIAVSGSIKIRISDSYDENVVELKNPREGLQIGPMIWREMFEFSPGAVLLVIADHEYDEKDYIRDKAEYEDKAKEYWKSKYEK